MDKWCIKWVITTNREYYAEHSRDKFFLQFDLALSKMDNEDRAKDIKTKMKTALGKWQWVSKAPDGYKNITIRKGHKDVAIDEPRAIFIRRMFELRCLWYSIPKICDVLFEEWFTNKNGSKIGFEVMKRKLHNKFYMWIMEWDWEEYKGRHIPLVTKSVFYKANNITAKRIYTKRERPYIFSGILKCSDGHSFRGYKTKGYTYYQPSPKTSYPMNISEKKVIEQAHTIFKGREFPDPVKKIGLWILEHMYKNVSREETIDKERINNEVNILKARKNKLLDSFLDGDIEKSVYREKTHNINTEIIELEDSLQKKSKFSREKFKKIQNRAELLFSAYSRESELTLEERVKILKNLNAELFITSKKELRIANSKLIETLQKLNNHIWYSHGELNSDLSLEKAAS